MNLMGYFNKRVTKENKNLMLIFVGGTGSGKSYAALKFGEMMNPNNFKMNRVVFKPEDFIALLNSDKLKRGDVIIFDEAGVGMPAREWYDISNKLMNYILQTFRHRNLIVIFTTPSLDFLDSQTRKLIHGIFESTQSGINYRTNTSYFRYYTIQNNPKYGKVYIKRLKLDGRFINPIGFKKPSEELIKKYEKRKAKFTYDLNESAEDRIDQKKKKRGRISAKLLEKRVRENIKPFIKTLKTGRKIFDWRLAKVTFNTTEMDAKSIKNKIEDEYNEPGFKTKG